MTDRREGREDPDARRHAAVCDVFRPDADEKVPVIMNIGVYQKDKLWVPPADLEEGPTRT
jgi:hypothetical protein